MTQKGLDYRLDTRPSREEEQWFYEDASKEGMVTQYTTAWHSMQSLQKTGLLPRGSFVVKTLFFVAKGFLPRGGSMVDTAWVLPSNFDPVLNPLKEND